MTFTDFWPTINSAIIAVFAWLISSVKSFGFIFQSFTQSDIDMYDGQLSLAMKFVGLLGIIVTFYYNLNKLIKQRNTMRPDGDADNESGRGSDLDPESDDDGDSQ